MLTDRDTRQWVESAISRGVEVEAWPIEALAMFARDNLNPPPVLPGMVTTDMLDEAAERSDCARATARNTHDAYVALHRQWLSQSD